MPPWPFNDPENLATFTLWRILRSQSPILYVAHDDDGWQFLDGDPCTPTDAALVCLKNVLKHDPTIATIADLPEGWTASRAAVGAAWTRAPQPLDLSDSH